MEDVEQLGAGAASQVPILFVVLEGDRPLARGARWSLAGVERITIGRGANRVATRSADGKTLDIKVPGRWISSSHCVVRAVGGEWIVEDAGSRNGTFVDGAKVATSVVGAESVLEAGR